MLGRITNQQLLLSSQRSLQASRAQLAQLQERVSTGKAVSRPSDDPSATASILRVRGEQRAVQQYATNITDGLAWLATVDRALSGSGNLLRQARDLTVQGANSGAMTPAAREAIATQLEGVRADLLQQANTTYLGRSVFAGTSDAGVAFDTSDPAAPYSYTGTAGASVARRINDTESILVDADGAAAFGTGGGSLFALIDDIVADLRAGADVWGRITELDTHRDRMSTQHALVGARYARMEQAQETNLSQSTALETQRSGIEDVDPAKAIIDLQAQELTYKTALAVTARALQPTLLDYLS
ncbi:flagellar hook-associated protein FlgL [Naasia sp. SYSU D00948]|uniref:flagellar hook-associated protein FlgL n=1 Tax=Naasia sp. SYSU D00948 TaxID=2817379 RepID=UPI001B3024E8|nr:flagellar hook-associated protein FlgL [Naasia sp. SYSU D00948]